MMSGGRDHPEVRRNTDLKAFAEDLIPLAWEKPSVGICMTMQLMALMLGGEIRPHEDNKFDLYIGLDSVFNSSRSLDLVGDVDYSYYSHEYVVSSFPSDTLRASLDSSHVSASQSLSGQGFSEFKQVVGDFNEVKILTGSDKVPVGAFEFLNGVYFQSHPEAKLPRLEEALGPKYGPKAVKSFYMQHQVRKQEAIRNFFASHFAEK
jgi:hypothetical protein